MKTTLHDILDGDLSEDNGGDLFGLPEERFEFAEHGKLREALRRNADVGGLTSAEKAEMRNGLAAAVGLTPSIPSAIAPVATGAASGWYLKGLAALILGVVIGAGLFMVLDKEPETVNRTIGVPVQTSVPSAVPFAAPEPAAGAGCDSLVQELRDSLKILQNQAQAKVKRKGGKYKWVPEEKPVPGD
jgi:hypothetical protein